ncbi:hypothetical protein RCL1_006371 [Eukaryota sp. TZLM3-RCL]
MYCLVHDLVSLYAVKIDLPLLNFRHLSILSTNVLTVSERKLLLALDTFIVSGTSCSLWIRNLFGSICPLYLSSLSVLCPGSCALSVICLCPVFSASFIRSIGDGKTSSILLPSSSRTSGTYGTALFFRSIGDGKTSSILFPISSRTSGTYGTDLIYAQFSLFQWVADLTTHGDVEANSGPPRRLPLPPRPPMS